VTTASASVEGGGIAAGAACCDQLVVWCVRLSALGCSFVCLFAVVFFFSVFAFCFLLDRSGCS
jgi:uncharacterized membrane protein